jgi:hypothetical protein
MFIGISFAIAMRGMGVFDIVNVALLAILLAILFTLK